MSAERSILMNLIAIFLLRLVRLQCVLVCLWLAHGEAKGAENQPWNTVPRERRTNLLIYPNQRGGTATVRSVRDWNLRRNDIVQQMQVVMGPWPAKARRVPVDLRVEVEFDRREYLLRAITYVSEADTRVPAWLVIPKTALAKGAKSPAVLCLHQTHAKGSKVVVGLGDSPNDEYAVELAKKGFVCIAPPYPLLADYQPDLKALGYKSGTMKAIWDNSRALDVLDSLGFVRKGNYGVIGHSLGGHNGIFTAVFDQRLKVIVSSCGFDSFEDYMNGNLKGWSQERYMPELAKYALPGLPFDFYEVIAALAPRKVFVNAPLHDSNFKWESVRKIETEARRIFELYRKPANLQVVYPDCAHLFPPETRQEAFAIMERELKQ